MRRDSIRAVNQDVFSTRENPGNDIGPLTLLKRTTVVENDNARPHKTQLVGEYFQAEDIQKSEWPAMSSGLYHIEHVRNVLGRSIAAQRPAPSTIDELKNALVQESGWLP
ncbi:hypothetical protein TNCV_904061 [Trichonephila clavipes]|nr:hypothetical protein TNCV_904061 [Trichonephila clavipes]